MIIIFLTFILLLPILIYLRSVDIARQKGKIHLYGIYGFFGLPGRGKTMSMCKYLDNMRKKYGDKILIMTNFNYRDQDIEFKTWKQLLLKYDKPLIVAWDEIQNEFNSRDFKSFPIQLLTQLTQVRKGNGIQILYTAQRWHFVDKNFRSLSFGCYECQTWLGRYSFARMYDPIDYDDLCSKTDENLRRRIKDKSKMIFIQTDKLRDSYDSYKMLETAKSKKYMTREEISKLQNINSGE